MNTAFLKTTHLLMGRLRHVHSKGAGMWASLSLYLPTQHLTPGNRQKVEETKMDKFLTGIKHMHEVVALMPVSISINKH